MSTTTTTWPRKWLQVFDGSFYDWGGIDEIRTGLAVYELDDNADGVIENLTYMGDERFFGFGNSVDNVIMGGDA